MRRIIRYRPSPAMAVAFIALLAAVGGVAVASIPDRGGVIHACYQKRGGALRVIDTARRGFAGKCRTSEKPLVFSQRGAAGLQGSQGIQGAQGAKGDTGAKGDMGAPGADGTARAYGRVASDATLSRSKNVTGVTSPATGEFCIALAAGIDASQTGLIAAADYSGDATSFAPNADQTIVEWASSGIACPAGQLMVVTGTRSVSTSGSGDGDVRTVTNTGANEPFFFVVP